MRGNVESSLTEFLTGLKNGKGLFDDDRRVPPADALVHHYLKIEDGEVDVEALREVLREAVLQIAGDPHSRRRLWESTRRATDQDGSSESSRNEMPQNLILGRAQILWALDAPAGSPFPIKRTARRRLPIKDGDMSTLDRQVRLQARTVEGRSAGRDDLAEYGGRNVLDRFGASLVPLVATLLIDRLALPRSADPHVRTGGAKHPIVETPPWITAPDGALEVDEFAGKLQFSWSSSSADPRAGTTLVELPEALRGARPLAVRALPHAVIVTLATEQATRVLVLDLQNRFVDECGTRLDVHLTAAAHSARGLYGIAADGRCHALDGAAPPPFAGVASIVGLDTVDAADGSAMMAWTRDGTPHLARWINGSWESIDVDDHRAPPRTDQGLQRPQMHRSTGAGHR